MWRLKLTGTFFFCSAGNWKCIETESELLELHINQHPFKKKKKKKSKEKNGSYLVHSSSSPLGAVGKEQTTADQIKSTFQCTPGYDWHDFINNHMKNNTFSLEFWLIYPLFCLFVYAYLLWKREHEQNIVWRKVVAGWIERQSRDRTPQRPLFTTTRTQEQPVRQEESLECAGM